MLITIDLSKQQEMLHSLRIKFEIDVKYWFLEKLPFRKGVNFFIIWDFFHFLSKLLNFISAS